MWVLKPPSPKLKMFSKKLSSWVNLNHPKETQGLMHATFLEPKKVEEALRDGSWVDAMHKELHQFTENDVWSLVP
jgi:hypothetical protein